MNMRAMSDKWYSEFLLRIGDGSEPTTNETFIRIPDQMNIPYTSKTASLDMLITAVFPNLGANIYSSEYITSRAILTTRNEHVDEINNQILDNFAGHENIYHSFDSAEGDAQHLYPPEFLNSLTVSGLPPHELRLKQGCPIILLRNIDPSNGLCNGTRLICKNLLPNVIDAEIATGDHRGKRVYIPRIPLSLTDESMFPFRLKRKQFPLRLSFCMTINKAQGQTIPYIGIYLPESVFSHGQLYVALSRGKCRDNTKVLIHQTKASPKTGIYTSNIVYREVLLE
jgi:ATP-dependent DNA helicase PIF1